MGRSFASRADANVSAVLQAGLRALWSCAHDVASDRVTREQLVDALAEQLDDDVLELAAAVAGFLRRRVPVPPVPPRGDGRPGDANRHHAEKAPAGHA